MQVMMLTVPVYMAALGEIPLTCWPCCSWAAWVLSLPVLLFSAGPFFGGAWRATPAAHRHGRAGGPGIVITFIAGTGATFDPGGRFGVEPF